MLLLTPEEFKDLGKQVIYRSVLGEDIYLIRHFGGYWDMATEMVPPIHLWTLAVEEQYYIFYSMLCWVLWKLKKRCPSSYLLSMLCFFWSWYLSKPFLTSRSLFLTSHSFLGTLFRLHSFSLSYRKAIKNNQTGLLRKLVRTSASDFLTALISRELLLQQATKSLGLFWLCCRLWERF